MSRQSDALKRVVLVHGAWVDGSGWREVYRGLTQAGFNVAVVQNPTTSLANDVAVTRSALSSSDHPVLLVGHSYGGAVITEAGNDQNVAGLVFVAGWVPDAGESVATLASRPWPEATHPPIMPPRDGFFLLDPGKFPESFAADVDADQAAFMADSQLPWGEGALTGTITTPSWRSKPSWYVVAADDKMIAPAAQRWMAERAGAATSEVKASHAAYVSQPTAIVKVIEMAARSL